MQFTFSLLLHSSDGNQFPITYQISQIHFARSVNTKLDRVLMDHISCGTVLNQPIRQPNGN
ncbi:hypothetical protein T01_9982 [Trichinella spiralis]|uniref:Uncharacterized protein n=1 Tax=Trichinella spiralis TaxID=6334 RepID=A0A0V1ARH6_TRISP|nr:hypothetical protein T01_9982 [Trichinella spiralis]